MAMNGERAELTIKASDTASELQLKECSPKIIISEEHQQKHQSTDKRKTQGLPSSSKVSVDIQSSGTSKVEGKRDTCGASTKPISETADKKNALPKSSSSRVMLIQNAGLKQIADSMFSRSVEVSSPVKPTESPTQQTMVNSNAAFAISVAVSTSTSYLSHGFIFGENVQERVKKNLAGDKSSGDIGPEVEGAVAGDKKATEENTDNHYRNASLETANLTHEAKLGKRKLSNVVLYTGEEGENNIIQINCKLYSFNKESGSWTEMGTGTLRLNDSDDGSSHRLIMRICGSHRVILNTKVWVGMTVQRANSKSLRITAMDDGQIKIYLIVGNASDMDELDYYLKHRTKKKLKSVNDE